MNIAVFCSSSNFVADKYKHQAYQIGETMALKGYTLVYGGATGGLMDSVAEGAASKEGKIIGVIPDAVIRMNRTSSLPTELLKVHSMSERKALMKKHADVFVVLPGSFGTLDEMLDIIASGIVGEHKKPIIIFNQDNFYQYFLQQIDLMLEYGFMPKSMSYKPLVCTCMNELFDLIATFNN